MNVLGKKCSGKLRKEQSSAIDVDVQFGKYAEWYGRIKTPLLSVELVGKFMLELDNGESRMVEVFEVNRSVAQGTVARFMPLQNPDSP